MEKSRVWLEVDDDDVYALATVEERCSDGTVKLSREGTGDAVTLKADAFARLAPYGGAPPTADVHDLVTLATYPGARAAHAAPPLRRAAHRTALGGSILLALNPYEQLALTTPDEIVRRSVEGAADGAPHVCSLVRAAHALLDTRYDQAILVSGESGAGKTRRRSSASLLAAVSRSSGASTGAALRRGCCWRRSATRAPSTTTTRAAGRWVTVSLDGDGQIIGAAVKAYLLERSRVVGHAVGERTFHIMYQVAAAGAHHYLRPGGGAPLEAAARPTDGDATWEATCAQLSALGFSGPTSAAVRACSRACSRSATSPSPAAATARSRRSTATSTAPRSCSAWARRGCAKRS